MAGNIRYSALDDGRVVFGAPRKKADEAWPSSAAIARQLFADDRGGRGAARNPHDRVARGLRTSWTGGTEAGLPMEEPVRFQSGFVHSAAVPFDGIHGEIGEVANDAIDTLNECLRGELSAVETYQLALRSVRGHELTRRLKVLLDSHDRRVTLLVDRIRRLGGEPTQGSGAWGAFARAVQRGADLFGDRVALGALEQGEDHGLDLYTKDLPGLDPETRAFLEEEILPEQRYSHDLCRSLLHLVKAA